MNSKILLSLFATAFLFSGYAVAAVNSPQPTISPNKPMIINNIGDYGRT
ncbi:hypothetical protein MEN41_10885 [Dolichospermum sp. ST_con]|nr:hypothetical protein [Dolichospermum sp. ST_con]MDD1418246.1 hypothetical protein [Dolichospermum sp. ST_sed1]MDD1423581.1 hypothetical protein [Dolichospermum sp. ST_sed9]MDD1432375.1 hypothetical protein [Dolichospermum sp. ST_sed6]MDD1436738.1 hypothetical protein [Dolichospermum sp. ST_sed10]MDD1442861.1 hypothetical protein [Dolichospermum sp. ST_sed3]MDD1446844.1 hypothetical protein [Dolichospermum sp. ST_sed8]MDD1457101.1 hypothetical protein [Dolichospermum sp. ST_sed7]MDD145912